MSIGGRKRRSESAEVVIDGETLTQDDVVRVAVHGAAVKADASAMQRVADCRRMIDELVAADEAVYGVTTGFGKFSDVRIPPEQTAVLQTNLIRSHACAVGRPLAAAQTRAVMLLRANTLVKGNSGVRPDVIELLIGMLNRRVHPVIPQQGSLGASGDLAPLAHLALALIGEGEALHRGIKMPAGRALSEAGLRPVTLGAKEGLALINGTPMMTALGALALAKASRLLQAADVVAAMTLQCLRGIPDAYAERLHAVRQYPEQAEAAANMRGLLSGSRLTTRPGELRVQDAYSLRCVPQVHGAARQAVRYAEEKTAIELNSATDNPLLFPEAGEVVSGGNFHGQPIAFAMDFMKIAMTVVAGISERRTERLVNPALSGLPPFLSREPGLASGLMIPQYVAASLVSENKVLAHPASVDSIPSSANQEDHVSMGTTAARHAEQVVDNTAKVLAIELICAAEAAEFAGKDGLSPATRALFDELRRHVPSVSADRSLSRDIERTARMLASSRWAGKVERLIGKLF